MRWEQLTENVTSQVQQDRSGVAHHSISLATFRWSANTPQSDIDAEILPSDGLDPYLSFARGLVSSQKPKLLD
jgi:hypothetical protein